MLRVKVTAFQPPCEVTGDFFDFEMLRFSCLNRYNTGMLFDVFCCLVSIVLLCKRCFVGGKVVRLSEKL